MADQLEEIKRKIDIVEFISSFVPLKKTGRNFKALCPFHSETIPSFIVSPERQIWHCFGACNEGGDIFKFLMKMENLEFGEALRELAKRAGVKLIRFKPSEGERQKQLLYEINHLAGEFYHWLLLNHPVGKRALQYILGRGINKESLQLFKLGFAPNTWESLQKFLVGKKGYKLQDLEKAGLVILGSKVQRFKGSKYYDQFRNRLMFPLKDHRGNICGFAGRTLDPKQKEAKYINTPETLIYHKSDLLYGLFETKDQIKKADGVILVEGELDAISSFQVGVKNVVAIKGSALTPNQVQLLSRFTKNIALALDRDIAGDQAAKRGIEVADSGGMAIKVVELKEGKDPDEIAQKNPNLWRELVAQSVPVYDYFLDSAFSRFDSKTAEGKRKIGQELIPILGRITDRIVQAHYIQALAERLGVDKEAVVAQIEKLETTEKTMELPQLQETVLIGEKLSRREILEEHLLALAFQSGKWNYLQKREVTSLVKTPRFQRILEVLGNYLKKYKRWESEKLSKMLPAELVESFNQLYLLNLGDLVTDEEKLAKEFQKTLSLLQEINLKEKLKEIGQKISQLESLEKPSKQDLKKLKVLGQEFRDLSTRLGEIGV
jgi:DNA primase